MAEKPIIEVQGLTKRFKGLTAVHDVSFSVEKGSITGMIGPNGAGKSTTFNMICGYYPPTEGKNENVDDVGFIHDQRDRCEDGDDDSQNDRQIAVIGFNCFSGIHLIASSES